MENIMSLQESIRNDLNTIKTIVENDITGEYPKDYIKAYKQINATQLDEGKLPKDIHKKVKKDIGKAGDHLNEAIEWLGNIGGVVHPHDDKLNGQLITLYYDLLKAQTSFNKIKLYMKIT